MLAEYRYHYVIVYRAVAIKEIRYSARSPVTGSSADAFLSRSSKFARPRDPETFAKEVNVTENAHSKRSTERSVIDDAFPVRG